MIAESGAAETTQYSADGRGALRQEKPFTTEDTQDTEKIHGKCSTHSQDVAKLRRYTWNLASQNGVRSCSGVRPSITAVMTSAVIGASRMPSRKWPVAT